MGLLVALYELAKPMHTEQLVEGCCRSPGWNRDHQKVQIRTVEELLAVKRFDMPPDEYQS